MRPVILVPRREGFADRDELWGWCRSWWERHLSQLPIYEGHHTLGLFNRSAAINTAALAADQHGRWDVAVIIDADVTCDPTRVLEAVERAYQTGAMVLPYTHRRQLNQRGTDRLMTEGLGEGDVARYTARTYSDGCSSVVVVRRDLWDAVEGFDEGFRGWGFEDNAFAAACITMSGQELVKIPGDLVHLHHRTAREGKPGQPSAIANRARNEPYRLGIGDPEAIRAARAMPSSAPLTTATIPRVLHRVVAAETTPQVEGWWREFATLNPDWQMLTWRDHPETGRPDPADFPEVARVWHRAANGAQLADLLRLEALWRHGGIYVDQDMQPLRSLEPLLPLEAFAAYEDRNSVPNAVMGARAGHPAIRECLDLAIKRVSRRVRDEGPGGTWEAGPGVTTKVLRGRDDVLLLPPGSFYPVHYRDKAATLATFDPADAPWAFAVHHWFGSWLPEEKRW